MLNEKLVFAIKIFLQQLSMFYFSKFNNLMQHFFWRILFINFVDKYFQETLFILALTAIIANGLLAELVAAWQLRFFHKHKTKIVKKNEQLTENQQWVLQAVSSSCNYRQTFSFPIRQTLFRFLSIKETFQLKIEITT